jgi:hypothetical protein
MFEFAAAAHRDSAVSELPLSPLPPMILFLFVFSFV